MKIAICADTHYDLNDGELKRTEDIDRTFNNIISEAIGEEIDVFIHLGDAFDNNHPTADSIAKFIRAISNLEYSMKKTFLMVGNHDIISQAGRTSALEVIDAIGYRNINVVSVPKVVTIGDVSLMFLPHMAKAHIIEQGYEGDLQNFWEETISDMFKKCTDRILIFAHHNISGAVSGSEAWMIKGDEQILPDSIFENRKVIYVFDGHIHKPQVLKKKKTDVIIVGSAECLNMGEKDDAKKFVIVEV